MYKALIVLCLAALAFADDAGYDKHDGGYVDHGKSGYDHGYDGGHHGGHYGYNYAHGANRQREAHVNYYNGLRQHAVNAAAEHYGAGTGTAAYYGVPGTPVGVYGHYGGYGYGRGYGHGHGYGYDNHHGKY